jgi:integrase
MASFPLVSATGMLGSGFLAVSLDKAISLGARMIGCDAGSTDPGPGPLATGTCMFSAAAVKRDTEIMVTPRHQGRDSADHRLSRHVGVGCRARLDGRHRGGIVREQNLHFKLAVIHSELSREVVRRHCHNGSILSNNAITQPDAWRVIRRRAAAAGIAADIGCHTFRATGITAYLANGGALEHAREMAAHESPRTKLYDRTRERLTQDEVERNQALN